MILLWEVILVYADYKKKLRAKYYWKNIKSTITKFVKACVQCKQNKHSIKTKETFIQTTTPTKPFDLISVDTIGPFTRSLNGNRYALTVQCDLSKFVIAVAIPDKQASILAKSLVENCFLKFGCPLAIKSDMGTEYKKEVFEQICKYFSIQQKIATAYHPETVGSLGRNHRCLNEFLRQYINDQHDD